LTILFITQYNSCMMNEKITDTVERLKQELRRGVIVVAVMNCLQESQYGYALMKTLNDQGFEIGQDTLYPLLRRLEEQDLLQSEWRVDDPRPRRYYQLNQNGAEAYEILKTEWKTIDEVIRRMINENE
jgi:PadR family transcriptional regulator PadR